MTLILCALPMRKEGLPVRAMASKNALISGYYYHVALWEWLIGTETCNGIMSIRLLKDNIELGKALLDICYMWLGGSWFNRDFLWFTW